MGKNKDNILDALYDESLVEDNSSNQRDQYDLSIYTLTNCFLEQILDFEYCLDHQKDPKDKLKIVKRYLKQIYKYKRKLQTKIDLLKETRDQLKSL